MKAAFLYQEPTPARMLVRFALVIGSLLIVAQLAVLLKPDPSNFAALIGLASIPALSVPVVEKREEKEKKKKRKKRKKKGKGKKEIRDVKKNREKI